MRYPDGFYRKEDPVNVFPFIAADGHPLCFALVHCFTRCDPGV